MNFIFRSLLLLPFLFVALFAGVSLICGEESGQTSSVEHIDAQTVARWSAPWRGWHYYADPIIPADYKIPGYEAFHSFDVPCVYRLPDRPDSWFMSFIGFNGSGYNSFVAESDDLIHWKNPQLAMGFGREGEFDHGGCAVGAFLYETGDVKSSRILKKKEGKFWTLYGCYPFQGGYELRPGYEGVASSDDGLHWTRIGDQPILSVFQDDCKSWEKDCIYQPWLVEADGKYYNFYNAAAGSIEQTGIAFSDDLLNWKRFEENPVVCVRAGGYDEMFASDPKVFRTGDRWTMFYFGVGQGGASIMIAFSRDLIHWTADPEPLYRFGGHPDGLDSQYAHKISLVYRPENDTWYLYYCACGNKGRTIGLLTDKPIPGSIIASISNPPFSEVPFTSVHFDDRFWAPRLKTNREVSIPHNYKWCEDTGRFSNFAKAGNLMEGKFEGIFFNDSDVYKVLEGTAYSLADHPDPELQARGNQAIDLIAAAQESNGYLNSYFTLNEPDKKWTNTRVMHELYCAGHLTEAAVAWKRATGEDKLLDVTERFIDHIIETFGPEPGKKVEVPGHEEIELALVKLYQLTGKEKYLQLAKFFIDMRGEESKRTDSLQGDYSQDHKPVRQQEEIMGHAVRAMYLYAGVADVADVAAYTGDSSLFKAMDSLWNDVVNKKMYITGGIGARHEGEAFGNAFELPNKSAYCETCAAIGLALWAHRLNLLLGEAKYAEVVERVIYNGVLSGIGRDGKSFFYVNPLSSDGNHHRQPFYDCACCPTNVIRFVPSLPGYQYAMTDEGIVVNLFVAGETQLDHPKFGPLKLTMETNYPWEGEWSLEVTAERPVDQFRIKVRESGECYCEMTTFITQHTNSISVNGDRDMEVIQMVANPHVVADRGRVALMRGPLVYCFEQCDNVVPVDKIVLAKEPDFQFQFKNDLLGGIGVITCKNIDGQTLTAIPYFAWDSREPGKMDVWVRQEGLPHYPETDTPDWIDPKTGEPILYRPLDPAMFSAGRKSLTLLERAIPDASYCFGNNYIEALVAGNEPKDSCDHDIVRLTFWAHKGTNEFVTYRFDEPELISSSSIYWFDDTSRGECRIPKSWKLSYLEGDSWVPVKTDSSFDTAKDMWHRVDFEPVKTEGLRIDIELQEGFSGGILGWNIE